MTWIVTYKVRFNSPTTVRFYADDFTEAADRAWKAIMLVDGESGDQVKITRLVQEESS